jgi:hypothetical protein
MAMIPELALGLVGRLSRYSVSLHGQTYNIPKLMAMPTPTFSFFSICRFQMIFHGSSASAKFIAADHDDSKIPYLMEISLGMQFPGIATSEVFMTGLHSIHGNRNVGVIRSSMDAIANHRNHLHRPVGIISSSVTAKLILLKLLARTDIRRDISSYRVIVKL